MWVLIVVNKRCPFTSNTVYFSAFSSIAQFWISKTCILDTVLTLCDIDVNTVLKLIGSDGELLSWRTCSWYLVKLQTYALSFDVFESFILQHNIHVRVVWLCTLKRVVMSCQTVLSNMHDKNTHKENCRCCVVIHKVKIFVNEIVLQKV